MTKLSYISDGIQILDDFLPSDVLGKLRVEADQLFKYTQLLGPAYCLRLNKYVCELPNPAARIQSINLLETAIDIHSELVKLGFNNYKLSHIAMYREVGNAKPLLWHSDIRGGELVRAQICISGGQINSGAFRYVKGSHHLSINDQNWEPSNEFLEAHKDDIVVGNVPNGSLILINTLGYHGKYPCLDERISFMFDFMPISFIQNNPNDTVSDVYLSSSRLSEKVLKNISLFVTGIPTDVCSPNTPDKYKFFKPFSGARVADFVDVLFVLSGRFIAKISVKFRNFFGNKLLGFWWK